MAKYETLNSNGDTKITIVRLAKKFNMSLVDFLDAMAKYFEITGQSKRPGNTFTGRRIEKIPGYNYILYEKAGE